MKFSDRMALEKEYKLWVEESSKDLGVQVDGSSLSTMLVFLEARGMLVEDTPQKRVELRQCLMDSGAVTVDPEVEIYSSPYEKPAYYCCHGATVQVDYIKLSNAVYKWIRSG